MYCLFDAVQKPMSSESGSGFFSGSSCSCSLRNLTEGCWGGGSGGGGRFLISPSIVARLDGESVSGFCVWYRWCLPLDWRPDDSYFCWLSELYFLFLSAFSREILLRIQIIQRTLTHLTFYAYGITDDGAPPSSPSASEARRDATWVLGSLSCK